jgi:hypothetical protein
MTRACVNCGGRARLGERTCGRPKCVAAERERAARRRASKKQKREETGVSTRQWRKLRDAKLERAGGVCEIGGRFCMTEATSVHLDPSFGPDHRPLFEMPIEEAVGYLTTACASCHGAIDGHRSRGGRGRIDPEGGRPAGGDGEQARSNPRRRPQKRLTAIERARAEHDPDVDLSVVTRKRCSKCGEVKAASEFNRNLTAKSGLASACRECAKAYARARSTAA